MPRWITKAFWVGLVVVLVALLVYAFTPKPIEVDTAKVQRGPFQSALVTDAKTRVRDRFQVSSPITGIAERITLDPGARVEVNQPLVRIHPPVLDPRTRAEAEARARAAESAQKQAHALVQTAQTALAQSRRELERMTRLAQQQVITKRQLELAQTDFRTRQAEVSRALFGERVAQREYESALAVLGQLGPGQGGSGEGQFVTVTAPVQGEVLRVLHESAGPVAAGTSLLELGDVGSLEVVSDVLTKDAAELRPGMPVVIDAGHGIPPLHGRIDRIEPSAFTKVSPLGTEEQRVNVIVQPIDPPAKWAGVGDAFDVTTHFITWSGDRVLQAPVSAVFKTAEGWAAYVVQRGKARKTPVQLGHRNESTVEVTSGLQDGDEVVLHPPDALKNGSRVRAR